MEDLNRPQVESAVTEKFTYNQVLEVLRQVIAESPLKVADKFHIGISYFGCRYLDEEGSPSCIVGVTLDRLGIPREEIAPMDWEARFVSGSCPQMVRASKQPLWGRFERRAKDLLADVQYYQDRGITWSGALEAATTEHLS